MRVARLKADGRILEAQSGDDAPMDALKKNAQAAGFKDDEVEFMVMPANEVYRLINEYNDAIPKPKSRLDSIEERLAALEQRR